MAIMSETLTSPMTPVMHRVISNVSETADTATLTFEPLNDGLPKGEWGQFNMIWAEGIGEAPISFSRVPVDNTVVHTIRAVGSVTKALCALRPGEYVGLRGPFGAGWPIQAARGHDIVLVAGGIGLAPLRPVVHEILENREDYDKVTLVIGARTAHDIPFLDEVHRWRTGGLLKVRITVDQDCSHWNGNVGIVTNELHRVVIDDPGSVAMICGPEIMMRFVCKQLEDSGFARDNILVTMERNMRCGLGLCGHCQLGAKFICTDGPVMNWVDAGPLIGVREL